jgi:hypothetical protein
VPPSDLSVPRSVVSNTARQLCQLRLAFQDLTTKMAKETKIFNSGKIYHIAPSVTSIRQLCQLGALYLILDPFFPFHHPLSAIRLIRYKNPLSAIQLANYATCHLREPNLTFLPITLHTSPFLHRGKIYRILLAANPLPITFYHFPIPFLPPGTFYPPMRAEKIEPL